MVSHLKILMRIVFLSFYTLQIFQSPIFLYALAERLDFLIFSSGSLHTPRFMLQKHYGLILRKSISKELKSGSVEILWGEKGAEVVASHTKADLVVSAMVGASGLKPTLSAIKSRKNVALANKEVLVMAGDIFTLAGLKNRT